MSELGSRLKYAIVRAHGLKTHLVPEETLKSWAFVTDDAALFSEIAKTEYGPFFGGPEDLRRADKIEEAHVRVMGRRARQLIAMLSGGVAEFFRTLLVKYDLENVRRLIYALTTGSEIPPKAALLPIDGFLLDIKTLAKANTVEQLISLTRVEKVREVLREWYGAEERSLVSLDLMLDAAYRDMVIQKAGESRALSRDRAFLEVLQTYLDRALLASALKTVIKSEVGLLKLFEGRLDPAAYRAVSTARSLREALESLARIERYRIPATEILKSYEEVGQPWILELALSRDAAVWARRYGSRKPLSPTYLLAYLVNVEWESIRVKTLLLARIAGLSGERAYDLVKG
ncbi:MAG: V-type ATPase subunit [Candidatus Korarchaeota archaeon]|nr:V-type ATPase subunit [Candidatus Korarchaeota archaeon]